MANVYVYSGAGGAGTGADWTNAYTRLDTALTAKAAGDVFWVAHDHAETSASAVTMTSPGTEATPCRIICVSRSGSVPPVAADLATTATVTSTGASAMAMAGSVSICYGIIFNCGTGGTVANLTIANTAGRSWRCEACAFRLINTATASRITPISTIWENCTVQFGNASQGIAGSANGRFVWKNTTSAITGATIPSSLVTTMSQCTSLWEGVDVSALTSGKFIMTLVSNTGTLILKNCKLSSTASLTTGTGGSGGSELQLIDCDSGDVHYRTERHNFLGDQTVETTIVRSGGASDGTTAISWKLVTTADSETEFPFEALPITIWNDTTGSSKTLTVQGIWGGGAVPLNTDIWIDVYAKTTSGFPIVTKYSSGRATPLTAGSNCSSGSGSWGGSTTSFSMAVSFTPAEKGPITVYVRAGLASSTFYIDPKVIVT